MDDLTIKNYKSLEELELDEEELTSKLKRSTKEEKVFLVPYALHLAEERERIKGFTFWEKLQYKALVKQNNILQKRIKKELEKRLSNERSRTKN